MFNELSSNNYNFNLNFYYQVVQSSAQTIKPQIICKILIIPRLVERYKVFKDAIFDLLIK